MGKISIKEEGESTASVASKLKVRLTMRNLKRGLVVFLALAVGILVWQYFDARAELKRFNDPAAAVAQESEDYSK
jgi:hypothetical protein